MKILREKQYAAFVANVKTLDSLRRNKVSYIPGVFEVAKVIVLSKEDFEKLSEDISPDYPFLRDNQNLMSGGLGRIFRCLLVHAKGEKENLLIAQGRNHLYLGYGRDYHKVNLQGVPVEYISLKEPKIYQERACFFWKAQGFQELTDLHQSAEPWSQFQVEQVVVLPDEQYRQFRENGLMEDQIFLFDHQDKMWMDPGNFCWHCVLVKGENSRDGVLVESEGYAYARYASYAPDCSRLRLQGVPVHYEVTPKDIREVQNAAERNRMEHYLSFVGAELQNLAFSLHFIDYDVGTDRFTTRLYGGPDSYIEEHLTPKQLADSHHFSQELREKFFDMDFRYQGEDLNHLPTADRPKKKAPRRGDAR